MSEVNITRQAGEPEKLVHDVSEQMGEPCILMGKPDWARHPITGEKLYFKERYADRITCPKGSHEADVQISTFVDSDIVCIECYTCKEFLWVRI